MPFPCSTIRGTLLGAAIVRRPLCALLVSLLVTACAHLPGTPDEFERDGYTQVPYKSFRNVKARDTDLYDLWWKESQDGGRRLRICLVPKPIVVGYNWKLDLRFDGEPTWEYQSGPMDVGGMRMSNYHTYTDCVLTPPLPAGVPPQMSVSFFYVK